MCACVCRERYRARERSRERERERHRGRTIDREPLRMMMMLMMLLTMLIFSVWLSICSSARCTYCIHEAHSLKNIIILASGPSHMIPDAHIKAFVDDLSHRYFHMLRHHSEFAVRCTQSEWYDPDTMPCMRCVHAMFCLVALVGITSCLH